MKSAAIILVIIIIVSVLNACVGGFVTAGIDSLSPYIDKAKEALHAGDLAEVDRQIQGLKDHWDEKESIWEAFVDHRDSEEVETMLTRLEAMVTAQTPELMLPELQELEFFLDHLSDMQKFRLENIF